MIAERQRAEQNGLPRAAKAARSQAGRITGRGQSAWHSAGLGLALATLGLPGRLTAAVDAPARADTAATSAPGWVRALLVAGHGLLATATLLLVVLAAIGAKGG